LIGLADVYMSQGRYEDAAKAYERVVRLQPDNVEALNNLAYAYDRAARYEDSIRALKKVISLNPADAFGFNNLGRRLTKPANTLMPSMHLRKHCD